MEGGYIGARGNMDDRAEIPRGDGTNNVGMRSVIWLNVLQVLVVQTLTRILC